MNIPEFLKEEPWCLIGGFAARAYAPERMTQDVDILVAHDRFEAIKHELLKEGWILDTQLFFPNASLGLYGQSFTKGSFPLDVIASPQAWAAEALAVPVYDQNGTRVIPLPYLVLMKLDSARGIGQGDLERMLGRVSDNEIEDIIVIVEKHSNDPLAPQDIRQYALLGRLELGQSHRQERENGR